MDLSDRDGSGRPSKERETEKEAAGASCNPAGTRGTKEKIEDAVKKKIDHDYLFPEGSRANSMTEPKTLLTNLLFRAKERCSSQDRFVPQMLARVGVCSKYPRARTLSTMFDGVVRPRKNRIRCQACSDIRPLMDWP